MFLGNATPIIYTCGSMGTKMPKPMHGNEFYHIYNKEVLIHVQKMKNEVFVIARYISYVACS